MNVRTEPWNHPPVHPAGPHARERRTCPWSGRRSKILALTMVAALLGMSRRVSPQEPTSLESVNPAGDIGNGRTGGSSAVTPDGRFVLFSSESTSLGWLARAAEQGHPKAKQLIDKFKQARANYQQLLEEERVRRDEELAYHAQRLEEIRNSPDYNAMGLRRK